MRINTNISAMNTYGRLTNANASKSNSLAKLSSGLRINKAGDDAAGLAISEKMKGQIGGLKQATRNAQDAVSLIQTAEGALNETHAILGRMRDLAVQGSNGTLSQDDRGEINKEFDALKEEITRISDTTEFNTKKLLNNEGQSFTFQIGANGGQTMSVTIGKMDSATLGLKDAKLAGNDSEDAIKADKVYTDAVARNEAAQNLPAVSNTYLDDAGKLKGKAEFEGAVNEAKSNLEKVDANIAVKDTVTTAGIDALFADWSDPADAEKQNVVFENDAHLSAYFQANGSLNASDADALVDNIKKSDVSYTAGVTTAANLKAALTSLTPPADNTAATSAVTTANTNLANYNLNAERYNEKEAAAVNLDSAKTQALDSLGRGAASDAIATIDAAIKDVSAQRSDLGAAQNRLNHTVKNLTTTQENLSEANSRIRDVDMAEEMMEFTKNNILSQAATSMLSQANAMPNSVLGLLQG